MLFRQRSASLMFPACLDYLDFFCVAENKNALENIRFSSPTGLQDRYSRYMRSAMICDDLCLSSVCQVSLSHSPREQDSVYVRLRQTQWVYVSFQAWWHSDAWCQFHPISSSCLCRSKIPTSIPQNIETNPTVDGRNPAPSGRWFIPVFIGLQPSKVVQDFFHPQYQCALVRVSECMFHHVPLSTLTPCHATRSTISTVFRSIVPWSSNPEISIDFHRFNHRFNHRFSIDLTIDFP